MQMSKNLQMKFFKKRYFKLKMKAGLAKCQISFFILQELRKKKGIVSEEDVR